MKASAASAPERRGTDVNPAPHRDTAALLQEVVGILAISAIALFLAFVARGL